MRDAGDQAHSLHLTGGKLYLCGLKSEVLEVLRRGGYLKQIGEDNIFHSKTTAVRSIVSRLDPQRCRYCKARIFKEWNRCLRKRKGKGWYNKS
jgi:SulP family sulfate permease